MNLRREIRILYEGRGSRSDHFRYGLLAFDLLTVSWLIVSSFIPHGLAQGAIDVCIGVVYLVDFMARIWISPRPRREIFSFWGLADVLVILSLLLPLGGEGLAFLRVLRLYRVLHSPQTLAQLRADIHGFRRNEDAIRAGMNLLIFIFAMTSLVYETQWRVNPNISNFIDALYFTVTTLTTTGFGDITLVGPWGRILAVAIMIFGISLFLRLIQVIFSPRKVRFPCPTCGLQRHDHDAVHCKACGTLLNIPDEDYD